MSCYYHEEKDKINIAPYPVLRMLKVLYTFMDIRSVFLVVIIPHIVSGVVPIVQPLSAQLSKLPFVQVIVVTCRVYYIPANHELRGQLQIHHRTPGLFAKQISLVISYVMCAIN